LTKSEKREREREREGKRDKAVYGNESVIDLDKKYRKSE
jgi:hypothetical protein